jgi:uncharacterized short protein YbdD (DUF466 family)
MFACGGRKHKTKPEFIRERIEKRDSMKALHPDTIVKYRETRWEKKKAKIDARFDSLRVAKDSINN